MRGQLPPKSIFSLLKAVPYSLGLVQPVSVGLLTFLPLNCASHVPAGCELGRRRGEDSLRRVTVIVINLGDKNVASGGRERIISRRFRRFLACDLLNSLDCGLHETCSHVFEYFFCGIRLPAQCVLLLPTSNGDVLDFLLEKIPSAKRTGTSWTIRDEAAILLDFTDKTVNTAFLVVAVRCVPVHFARPHASADVIHVRVIGLTRLCPAASLCLIYVSLLSHPW